MISCVLQHVIFLVALISVIVAQTEFRRVCRSYQLDVGIRRWPGDLEATHTCVPGPRNGRCFIQDASMGFNCTGNFQLQGGLENRRSLCCEKAGFDLVGCYIPRRLFSFRDGFNIQRTRTVLRSIVSNPTQNDETTFVVELCFLRRRLYDFYPKYL
ncbi:uncharacterized protein LOC128172475 [Crassostrea angulata]|uniref:uncharacterized protein LOC128172475 n=1 Tax=Magallana angulata TaxID=2784310 RepID=UPI0022B1D5D1|nr:uncharacterized protein LOC128172475 [Crassostrea angulata]